MNNFPNKHAATLCQGVTGKAGTYHTRKSLDYGTHIVAGVTPGKGGTTHLGLPVFNTVQEATTYFSIDVSMIYVPAPQACKAILEAIHARIPWIVCITEGIPVHDMIAIKQALKGTKSKLIGPNTPGMLIPSVGNWGLFPGAQHSKGSIGILSRSGTLTYEVIHQLSEQHLGISVCLGIGGDPIVGNTFADLLPLLLKQPHIQHILILGEIGGEAEQEAAKFLEQHKYLTHNKTIFAFIAGASAPPYHTMGHAGALLNQHTTSTAWHKKQALQQTGAHIIPHVWDIGAYIKNVLQSSDSWTKHERTIVS